MGSMEYMADEIVKWQITGESLVTSVKFLL